MGEDRKLVKPLEWVDITSPREDGPREPTGDWEANTLIGDYSVVIDAAVEDRGDDWEWSVCAPNESLGHFADLDEAKAAAQADYEARIRSALNPSHEARIAELEGALRELDAAYDDDAWNDSSDPRHGDAMNRVVAAVSASRAALGIEVKESDR